MKNGTVLLDENPPRLVDYDPTFFLVYNIDVNYINFETIEPTEFEYVLELFTRNQNEYEALLLILCWGFLPQPPKVVAHFTEENHSGNTYKSRISKLLSLVCFYRLEKY